ncbi:MAG: DUF1573 domain-containing protein [Bacteroides helcogenes]|nr:DUF1573 domain-containing protein [Bacteroides helcogenes]MDY5238121.1 DUF1573 domain-containing protein [Bacteroides helcogenes]
MTKEWSGKELIFPQEFILDVYLEDSVISYNKVEIPQYAIFTYLDSIGCMSCKMNLPEWTNFILELDSISNKTVPCLFIFNPKSDDQERIINLLRRAHFSYPVCIDKKDSFNLLNEFPKDDRFQTFLLDRDNKVLALGNPIHNPKVKELYLKIIRGDEVRQGDKSKVIKTEVGIDNASLSLGRFDWHKEQKASFTLRNTGDKPLVIQDVVTSCGCTSVSYSPEPVLLGRDIALEVTYKAEHPEHFNKTITVYCNAVSSPIILKISGNAK